MVPNYLLALVILTSLVHHWKYQVKSPINGNCLENSANTRAHTHTQTYACMHPHLFFSLCLFFQEFVSFKVQHSKVPCPGQEVPSVEVYKKYVSVCLCLCRVEGCSLYVPYSYYMDTHQLKIRVKDKITLFTYALLYYIGVILYTPT